MGIRVVGISFPLLAVFVVTFGQVLDLSPGGGKSELEQPHPQSPRPVRVVTFPDPQNVIGIVEVSNLGDVQVGGSIEVTNPPAVRDISSDVTVSNLPIVQQVAGEVVVSNLENLFGGQNFSVLEVPAFVEACGPTTSRYASDPFDLGGWRQFSIYLQTFDNVAIGPTENWSMQFKNSILGDLLDSLAH